MSFDEYPFKRLVVLKFFKQRQPCPFSFLCHGSVEHVETSSARTYTGATRHTGRIKTFSREVNLMTCVPFSLPPFPFPHRCITCHVKANRIPHPARIGVRRTLCMGLISIARDDHPVGVRRGVGGGLFQGFTPLAIHFRPFGTKNKTRCYPCRLIDGMVLIDAMSWVDATSWVDA